MAFFVHSNSVELLSQAILMWRKETELKDATDAVVRKALLFAESEDASTERHPNDNNQEGGDDGSLGSAKSSDDHGVSASGLADSISPALKASATSPTQLNPEPSNQLSSSSPSVDAAQDSVNINVQATPRKSPGKASASDSTDTSKPVREQYFGTYGCIHV
jgi:hypothetical protein